MTRLEALEAVARAARDTNVGCMDWDWETTATGFRRAIDCGRCPGCRMTAALAALDQSASQPPGADPQPHRGSVADTAGIFAGGPDSVEWLREQRGVPMIPDLLAQAHGADALAALDRPEASTHDASGGPPAPYRRPSEDPT